MRTKVLTVEPIHWDGKQFFLFESGRLNYNTRAKGLAVSKMVKNYVANKYRGRN